MRGKVIPPQYILKMSKDPSIDQIIKFVISSNLDEVKKAIKGEPPIVADFPICGKWRKNLTLLHLAAAYGSLTCITFFLGKIDINCRTLDNWTPLHCAAANKHRSAVDVLLKNGADASIANDDFQTPLHLAAMNGSADVILALLASGVDADAKTENGYNAIHYAASASLSSVIDPLLLSGADIDCAAKDGTTPLHIAAKLNAFNFANALISFGANVNAQDNTGSTPLHYAIANSHFNVAKILLSNGADDSIRNNGGQTASDTAPVPMINQTRAFFANWEDWDEMVESIEIK